MNDEITRVKSLPDFKLQVTLADGRQGVFSLVPHLASPGLIALRDPAYFSQVQILFGAATWPDGEDIAPETMAAELKAFESV